MKPWSFSTAGQIRFGAGRAREAVAEALSAGRNVLLVAGRDMSRSEWLADEIRAGGGIVMTIAVPREPDLAMIEKGVSQARAFAPDAVLGIGGGSALDAAKAIAALVGETGEVLDYLEVVGQGRPLAAVPPLLIALPTTAGTGAEVTRNAVIGVPESGRKVSLRDARLLPRIAIVDPNLTLGTPGSVTAAAGLDAITQVIEPYLSPFATPVTDALCRDAIPRGLTALPRVLEAPDDGVARAEMAWVSLCGGLALANAKLGAVHGLAGVIGGRTGAAHGAICGRLLPRVLAANEAALAVRNPEGRAFRRLSEVRGMIAHALGGSPNDAIARLNALVDAAGLPSVADLGIGPSEIVGVAEASRLSSSMKGNPIELSSAELERILRP